MVDGLTSNNAAALGMLPSQEFMACSIVSRSVSASDLIVSGGDASVIIDEFKLWEVGVMSKLALLFNGAGK